MALKQAKIFKDFYIAANADNTGVTFSMNSPLTVSVKNDNFAQQVQILDNADTTDLFDYKYITFDGHAVFEITDCIKNDKYTTLFVQYLSNIKFDTVDSNFRIDAVSAYTLQRLGLDINDFLRILGNNAEFSNYPVSDITNPSQELFFFAIKLRLSEIPQNLTNNITPTGEIRQNTTHRGTAGNRICNQSINSRGLSPSSTENFSQFDNAFTCILPIPVMGAQRYFDYYSLYVPGTKTFLTRATISSLLTALNDLITDLTLTAEITVISESSLICLSQKPASGTGTDMYPLQIEKQGGVLSITFRAQSFGDNMFKWLRVVDNHKLSGFRQPIICAECDGQATLLFDGFWEVFNHVRLYLETNINTGYQNAILSFNFLGNVINLSKLRNNYVYLKRNNQSIRVFIDIEQNIYTDIVTTFEFSKNAYSNFDAYRKANIELTQNQSFEMLEQQQRQARQMQTLDTAFAAAGGVSSAAGAAASGFMSGGPIGAIVGGVTSAANTAMNIAHQEIKFNMQQQNDIANAKLAASHQLEAAQSTIVPSSETLGSLNFTDIFSVNFIIGNTFMVIYSLTYIPLPPQTLALVEKYAFDNLITDKVLDVSQITKPQWQTLHNYFVVKIENRSVINNRKGLIIFAEIRS